MAKKDADKLIKEGSAAVKRVNASNPLGSVDPSEQMPSPEDMAVLIDHIIRAAAEAIEPDVGGNIQHRTKIVQALVVPATKLREFIDAMVNQYLEDNRQAIVLSQKGLYSQANDLIQKAAGIELVLMAASAFMPSLKLVDIPDLYKQREVVQWMYAMTSNEVTATGEKEAALDDLHAAEKNLKLADDLIHVLGESGMLDAKKMKLVKKYQFIREPIEDPKDIP